MGQPPVSITEAESIVMEVLWNRSPMPTEEVVTALEGEQHWQEATIKTLLDAPAEEEGRSCGQGWAPLSPVPQRSRVTTGCSAEQQGLLDRLFSGRVAPLAAHFSRHGKLSKRDIADLKKLIADIDDGD